MFIFNQFCCFIINYNTVFTSTSSWGIKCEIVDPQKAKELCPLIRIDDIKGAMWIPEDGVADSYKICLSLLEAAKQKGAWKLFAFRYALSRFIPSLSIYS